jgi:hypothetical protein
MISRREFALVVVVSLFGAALLHRATEPRREHQRAVACYSNLKRIGLAIA